MPSMKPVVPPVQVLIVTGRHTLLFIRFIRDCSWIHRLSGCNGTYLYDYPGKVLPPIR